MDDFSRIVGEYEVHFHARGMYYGHPEHAHRWHSFEPSLACWQILDAEHAELARVYEPTPRTPHRVYTGPQGEGEPELDRLILHTLIETAKAQRTDTDGC